MTVFAQQPQAPAGTPVYSVNAKYVNGMAPGYWPTAGTGLVLNLSAGTAYCGNPPVPVSYPGGSLALTASATNYVYLDPSNNCSPTASTATFAAGQIPVAKVVTGVSSITSITDARTWFTPQPCVTGSAGDLHCSSLGTNQNIALSPSGSGATVITNLADKGGQVFNVKAYGADGTAANDDAAYSAAHAAAVSAGGGIILFPAGNYTIDGTISFGSNIRNVFTAGTITVNSASGATPFQFDGTGSSIECPAASYSTGSPYFESAVKFVQGTGWASTTDFVDVLNSGNQIRGCMFDLRTAPSQDGIAFLGSTRDVDKGLVQDALVVHAGRDGVRLESDAHHVYFIDLVRDWVMDAANDSYHLIANTTTGADVDKIEIDHCVAAISADTSTVNAKHAMEIETVAGSSVGQSVNSVLVNSLFSNTAQSGQAGIQLTQAGSGKIGPFSCVNCYVEDTAVISNPTYAINVSGASANIQGVDLLNATGGNFTSGEYPLPFPAVNFITQSAGDTQSIFSNIETAGNVRYRYSGYTITDSVGSGAPSGSCQTGSTYRNISGSAGTTFYVCEASAWVAN